MTYLICSVFCLSLSVCIEASIVTSPFLFPESELVTEPEEDDEEDTKEAEEAEEDSTQRGVDCPSLADSKF